MPKASSPILRQLRSRLSRAADPAKALQMRAYMKSTMPFYGVQTPLRREICRDIFKQCELPDAQSWQRHVLDIWRNAKYREERYAALQLAADKRARTFHTPRAIPMYEEMIVSGAWWDYVDDLAHRVGDVLEAFPKEIKPMLLKWSRSDNLWKRRVSIISQLSFKQETDLKLLYSCIEPSLGSNEFFLQKAIGWALRQYAWTDSKEIRRYVAKNQHRLSPLSKREALKHC